MITADPWLLNAVQGHYIHRLLVVTTLTLPCITPTRQNSASERLLYRVCILVTVTCTDLSPIHALVATIAGGKVCI